MKTLPPPVRFTLNDSERAWEEWGCNCGPGAVAGVCGFSLDEIRPHLGDFEAKRYTNPTLMWAILNSVRVQWQYKTRRGEVSPDWPRYGLGRIQWEGPWTAPGVPIRVRYRHTHWVGSMLSKSNGRGIFDINCMNTGGWVSLENWSNIIAPHLIKSHEQGANGKWHITHSVEIDLG